MKTGEFGCERGYAASAANSLAQLAFFNGLLVVAAVIGIWARWLSSGRIPVQEIRDLQQPAAERNEQINELANP